MDIRKEFLGGEIGVTNTELNLMPNANRGGIHTLGLAMTNGQNAILQGVNAVIGADSVTFDDGFVFLDGEVLKVDGATVNDTIGNDLYIFQKAVNNADPAFQRLYRDGSVNNVADIIRAEVVPVGNIQPDELAVDGITVRDLTQPNFAETNEDRPAFLRNRPKALNVINLGAVGNLDPVDPFVPTLFGDVASVTGIVQEDASVAFTITWANPAPTIDYMVRYNIEREVGSTADDDTNFPIYDILTESTTRFIVGNDRNVSQTLRLWVEMVYLDEPLITNP